MSSPGWLAGCFAVLMIAVAAYCASRLAVSRLRGKDTERTADGLHVLMGIAMAGMLEPRLTPVPGIMWRAVFAAAAAWFAWQASPAGRRASRPRCAHPAPHAIESAAMVYMLAPLGSWPAAHGPGMAMPGTTPTMTAGNPALTLVLALFMLGYALWAADRLALVSRARATAPAVTRDPVMPATTTAYPRPALAPRLAACYKIAMAITMGYMLITML
jgi:hypothetical protein